MARTPLLQLTGLSLTFGGDPIFDALDLIVQPGDRLALVGRNGSGKSTLMKVMAGQVEPDQGLRVVAPGVSVGYMEQDPDLSGFETLGDFALRDLDPSEAWRVEMAAEGLKFDPTRPVATASGGEKRRAALAKLLGEAPELMLLDEPTNHLDIEAITWLEQQLRDTNQAYVLISHDRMFLRELTRGTLWIDRGNCRRSNKGFAHFEAWRDTHWAEEDLARHKLNRKIKSEARWAVEGISARRKRNQGRVRALQDLRAERAAQIKRQGVAAMALEAGPKSGRKVIEARGISKTFGDNTLLKPFDLRMMRGDRVGFVGPNGAGKTTLLKMLIGELAPDTGSVSHGTGLEMAFFDQSRAGLDGDKSLWDNLAMDPTLGVSGRSDQIMVRGAPRHVVGYLKDFLFDERQVRAPVRSLSGGEKARLLLARLMARPSNLLVMDEPTNDFDIETLDLLQELLDGYDGTVLLVSHDRDFLDRVATTTVALEGQGRAVLYAGGWSDAQVQRAACEAGSAGAPGKSSGKAKPGKSTSPGAEQAGGAQNRPDAKAETNAKFPSKSAPKSAPKSGPEFGGKPAPLAGDVSDATSHSAPESGGKGLSFTEKHRLAALPAEMERLEAEIAKLGAYLADPELFSTAPLKFKKASEALAERQDALGRAEECWLELEEKASSG